MNLLKNFWKEEDGQDLIEYGLLAGFIALGVVATLGTLRTSLQGGYGNINTQVGNAMGTGS